MAYGGTLARLDRLDRLDTGLSNLFRLRPKRVTPYHRRLDCHRPPDPGPRGPGCREDVTGVAGPSRKVRHLRHFHHLILIRSSVSSPLSLVYATAQP